MWKPGELSRYIPLNKYVVIYSVSSKFCACKYFEWCEQIVRVCEEMRLSSVTKDTSLQTILIFLRICTVTGFTPPAQYSE